RGVDADAEHQQVAEGIQHVPEDEQRVGRADLAFADDDGGQGVRAHDGTPAFFVGPTNTSWRLAPPISTRSTRPCFASSETSSSTRASSSCSRSCTVLCVTVTSAVR